VALVSKRQALLDWLVADAGPLKTITELGGYENTVSLVQRGQRDPDDLTDADYPFLFVSSTDETREIITATQFTADLTVLIIGGIKSPNGVSGAHGEMDTLIADVTKTLMTDHKQGGRCYFTNVERIRTDPGDIQAHALCFIEVKFKYATEGTVP